MFFQKKFFSKKEVAEIHQAIHDAELNTSGEIRVHIEDHAKGDAITKATEIFAKLEMNKTELKNGVLFYLAVKDRTFAIIGDEGIDKKVPSHFWDEIKNNMTISFKKGEFVSGLCKGIEEAGRQLKTHFPYSKDDKNELPNEISFGN